MATSAGMPSQTPRQTLSYALQTNSRLAFLLTSHLSLLTGQTLPRQTDFQTLRDSLASTSDTTTLRRMQQAVRRSDPLRAGVIGLRLGELRADSDFSDALSSFGRASQNNPGRPEPWFGLALAETGRSEWEMRNPLSLGSRVGMGSLERSAADHIRALKSDLRFVPAALALADVSLALLDTARLRVARNTLRAVTKALPLGPPALFLAWGRVERAAGSLDSAAVAFGRYLSAGGNRALGLLELARTQLAQGRTDGEAPYYEGASLDDAEATAGYRADLALLVGSENLGEFDQLRGAARVGYPAAILDRPRSFRSSRRRRAAPRALPPVGLRLDSLSSHHQPPVLRPP